MIDLEQLAHALEQFAKSKTTRRLYLSRVTFFASWCSARGVDAVPADPEVLRRYLMSLADEQKALSTITVSMAAIAMAHRTLGHDVPASEELRTTLRALRLDLRRRSPRSSPLSLDALRQILAPCGQGPLAIRDRALILATYFAGLGRMQAVGLNREGVHREEPGYRLTLASASATTENIEVLPRLARLTDLDLCPVRALEAWLVLRAMWARGPELSPMRGPLFVAVHQGRRQRLRIGDRLAPSDIDRIVKRRAAAAGLSPAGLSAGSLRAGFRADAARLAAIPTDLDVPVRAERSPA